jgi:hypothetical protein
VSAHHCAFARQSVSGMLSFDDVSAHHCAFARQSVSGITIFKLGFSFNYIQGVTGGTDQTSGECSLGHTIPI